MTIVFSSNEVLRVLAFRSYIHLHIFFTITATQFDRWMALPFLHALLFPLCTVFLQVIFLALDIFDIGLWNCQSEGVHIFPSMKRMSVFCFSSAILFLLCIMIYGFVLCASLSAMLCPLYLFILVAFWSNCCRSVFCDLAVVVLPRCCHINMCPTILGLTSNMNYSFSVLLLCLQPLRHFLLFSIDYG